MLPPPVTDFEVAKFDGESHFDVRDHEDRMRDEERLSAGSRATKVRRFVAEVTYQKARYRFTWFRLYFAVKKASHSTV